MPIFDGFVIGTRRMGDRRLILGTRGLLVVPDGMEPVLDIEELDAPIERGLRATLVADAKKRRPRIHTVEELKTALGDRNPFYRAAALQNVGHRENPEFVPLAAAQLADPVREVRAAAVYLFTRIDDGALVVPPLRRVLADPDPVLRAHATVHLCRHGAPPDASFIADVLARRDGYPAIGGVGAGKMEVYEAVAPFATPEVFAVMIEYPLSDDNYQPRQKALRELGRSLQENPEAVPFLMTARNIEQIRFVRAVCGYAGPAILPQLIHELASDDRVVRSNAAIALGAVGDPAAIPHLLRALDRESGLSRAGAVRALGDLKANAALPRLTELYVSARSDPGGGYRAGQAAFGYQREYERIEGFDAIALGWDELKAALQVNRPRPEKGERLLTPELILDSIRAIGPEASQEFYRRLAADGSTDARQEAAIGLASCPEEGRDEAVAILDSLLLDDNELVRAEAAVSLALLDLERGRETVARWLSGPDGWAKERTLRALRRVTDRSKIEFVIPRLQEIRDDRNEPRGHRDHARDILRQLK